MPHYKFDQIAFNITDKKIPEPGDEKLYIGLEHLDSGSLKVTRWGNEIELTGQKLIMKKGDVLFGRRNTYLRRAAIAPHDGIFSAHGMIFRPKTQVIDPEYFPFFISSNYFMDAAIRISVGSLSPTVNWKTLKELEFDLPSLEEQRKNAALLKSINDTKEAYQDLLVQTDALVKAQFLETFKSDKVIYPTVKLCDLCTEILAGGDRPKDTSDVQNDEYPYPVFANAATNDGLLCYAKNYRVDKPGVTIAARGCTVGFTAVREGKYTPVVRLISLVPDERVTPVYLKQYLDNTSCLISNGSAQPQITIPAVKGIEISVPPVELQKEYEAFVTQSQKAKKELDDSIKSCDDLIKSILYKNLEKKEG